jgi:T5SS/PEP-CTERM-associated repeat protein
VTVSGPGSTWTTGRVYIADGRYTVFVGDAMGRLNVTDGGTVSGSGGCIGYGTDSVGEVMVSGAGSTWDNSGGLTVGWNGRGTLYVVAGGSVSATDVTINALSTVGVYGGSLIVNGGSGTITNDGRIHITAAVNAPPGTTQPISAALWQGSGTYSAIGGKWNSTTHQLAVSDALQGASGAPISVDLFDTQRLLIHDPATDWSLGAGFTATDAPTTLTLSASAISGSTLSDLQSLLRPGESLLGGWQITPTSGYTPGDPAYLSFAVGAGRSAEDLFVWHYDGTWSRFDAADLTYDGNYASFTVTGFSDYAISAVPEPSTLALLASALLCAAVWAWRKKR